MKKTLRFSIAALLVVLAVGIMSFTVGKHSAPKETKKFATEYFTFDNGSVTNPDNWDPATSSLCPTGTAQLCGISFDAAQAGYALNPDGKPNSNILSQVSSNIAGIIAAGNHTGTISYNGSTITVYLKP